MKKIVVGLLFMTLSCSVTAQTNTASASIKLIDPEICMVTCNVFGTHNEVRWNPAHIPYATTVYVYRLDKSGNLIGLGEQAAKDSVFIDNGPNAGHPDSSSHKYIIKYSDKKQKLSGLSLPHQTIFVRGNQKGQFTWNAYEIAPTNTQGKVMYQLWRKSKDGDIKMLLSTEKTTEIDTAFSTYRSPNTIWWITLDDFNCDSGKNGTKSNNSNE